LLMNLRLQVFVVAYLSDLIFYLIEGLHANIEM
jgi:hypothetical protein